VDVAEVITKARAAQQAIDHWTAEQVDDLTTAVAYAVARKDRAEGLARLAVDEAGFGNYADKVTKIQRRVLGVLSDLRTTPTVGVVEENPARGLVKIAKPVGVVAALIPTTGPDATPPVKALWALAGRNAVVFAAHPRSKQTTDAVVAYMRAACEQVGAPADLIQSLPEAKIEHTQELMRRADLIVATGGAGMVKAAYSSGTPAFGVGVGNCVHVVDETGDVVDAADAIATSKTFDYATSCLADNAVVAHDTVHDELLALLLARGGHLCTDEEKQRLQAVMWPDGGEIPSAQVIAKSAQRIAQLAGIPVPDTTTFLIVAETGAGPSYPFSGEKLSVVLALYRYSGGIDNAVAQVNAITDYQGLGHTCGIHTSTEAHVQALADGTRTARVLVNQSLNEGAGSARNGLPFTLSLGCGTWGGTITTENINARHFVNLTWVSRPITPKTIDADALFERHFERYGR
jgi:sulfoacetaldehyde dehydrogenase